MEKISGTNKTWVFNSQNKNYITLEKTNLDYEIFIDFFVTCLKYLINYKIPTHNQEIEEAHFIDSEGRLNVINHSKNGFVTIGCAKNLEQINANKLNEEEKFELKTSIVIQLNDIVEKANKKGFALFSDSYFTTFDPENSLKTLKIFVGDFDNIQIDGLPNPWIDYLNEESKFYSPQNHSLANYNYAQASEVLSYLCKHFGIETTGKLIDDFLDLQDLDLL